MGEYVVADSFFERPRIAYSDAGAFAVSCPLARRIASSPGAYEDALRDARQDALREMAQSAADLGADAVVGVDIDYEVLGRAGSMLMVTSAGTAVKLG